MPTVVITGASSGIGAACAHHLSDSGWLVYAGVRSPTDGEVLAAGRDTIVPIDIDVTDPVRIAAAAAAVRADLAERGLPAGGLTLINNAGLVVAGPLEFLPLEQLRRQLEVNVIGQIAVTQAFLPLIRTRGDGTPVGRVVMIGSISGRIALPFLGPYSASKAALAFLCDALRRELAPWRIAVVLLEAGRIATPLRDKTMRQVDAMLEGLQPAAHQLYGDAFRRHSRTRLAVAERTTAAQAAIVIERILTRHRPRARYLLGSDARLAAAVARLIPRRLLDRMVR